jgi:hypothetical protein
MKVKTLIDILSQAENKDLEIIVSSDAEGNEYHSINGVDKCGDILVITPNHDSVADRRKK